MNALVAVTTTLAAIFLFLVGVFLAKRVARLRVENEILLEQIEEWTPHIRAYVAANAPTGAMPN